MLIYNLPIFDKTVHLTQTTSIPYNIIGRPKHPGNGFGDNDQLIKDKSVIKKKIEKRISLL